MPRLNDATVLIDGRPVGFSLTERPGGYRVRFVDPAGRRVERATGCDRKGDARAAGEALVRAEYAPPSAPEGTWAEALAHLAAVPDLRTKSVKAYRLAAAAVRGAFPELVGPAAVTPAHAARFPARWSGQPYRRGHRSDAATYRRSPDTVNSCLTHLSSLWRKHWKPAGFVPANVWAEVPKLNAPRGRRVRVPAETAVVALMRWLADRYPEWELPRLFVTVKAVAGCRTFDLCQARTADLTAAGLTLPAAATKDRRDRAIPLPPDVAADLRRVAGPVFVWERAAVETPRFRPARGKGASAYDDGFRPESWRHTVENLFREFNDGRPTADRVRPHDLRARAMTAAGRLLGSADAVAQLLGCDPQTARHYIERGAYHADAARLWEATRPTT